MHATNNESHKGLKYRSYSPEQMENAYKLYQKGYSIYKAAKLSGVPKNTLRDRTAGLVSPKCIKSGTPSLFSNTEESDLVQHSKETSVLGYGYSRKQLANLISDTAIFLGKRPKNLPRVSQKWVTKFIHCHPELKCVKPRPLSMYRAKCCTPAVVNKYFTDLKEILEKYDLLTNPSKMFNIDETGFSPEHCPPKVIGDKNVKLQSVTSPRSFTTTVIGAASASGVIVPPYFVFKGKRSSNDLMEGAAPGSSFSMSDSGWSNSTIFQDYLKNHFIKDVPNVGIENIVVFYDGHKSHVCGPLIEWANENKIILYILPPHTSHLLQPLDVGMFGPLKKAYYAQVNSFMRNHVGQVVSRYNICSIISKAYLLSMTPSNAVNAFKKSGIFPYNPLVISGDAIAPKYCHK